MIVTIDNCREFMINGGLKTSFIYPIKEWEHFRIEDEITIKLSNKEIIVIPVGFIFDGSSSPNYLRGLFPRYGDFILAALIHDFCYKTDYKMKEMGAFAAQRFADDEMLLWSMVLHNNSFGNKLRWKAVRWFGKSTYIK